MATKEKGDDLMADHRKAKKDVKKQKPMAEKLETRNAASDPKSTSGSAISPPVFYSISTSGSASSSPVFYSTSSPGAYSISTYRDPDTLEKTRKLEEEITQLRRKSDDLQNELASTQTDKKKGEEALKSLLSTVEELSKKEKLGFLLERINGNAHKLLFESATFQKKFLEENESKVFVMSMDIRRSTELMAKARTPQQFAEFMTRLCTELGNVIKDNYGVIDKFTGDGVLAFFPDFFSEDYAGLYAVTAADRCHKVFQERYKEYRTSFYSVLTDVGLGIGIDYGVARLVQIAGGLTVVGVPVVYACRMSGAKAGTTLLNQPAYELLNEKFSSYCFFTETEIDIKNEGPTLAYEVRLSGKEHVSEHPSWARDLSNPVGMNPLPEHQDSQS